MRRVDSKPSSPKKPGRKPRTSPKKKASPPRTVGRPSRFTPELGHAICRRLAGLDGDAESLRTICSDPAMPARGTVYNWLLEGEQSEDPASPKRLFLDQYARARECWIADQVEAVLEIADDGSNDWMERELQSGRIVEILNTEVVQRSRLRVDARRWLAEILAPKKYGKSMKLRGDPDQPLVPPPPPPDPELHVKDPKQRKALLRILHNLLGEEDADAA